MNSSLNGLPSIYMTSMTRSDKLVFTQTLVFNLTGFEKVLKSAKLLN